MVLREEKREKDIQTDREADRQTDLLSLTYSIRSAFKIRERCVNIYLWITLFVYMR